jgi:transcriptional regulator with XRE-family HTH domain
MRGDIYLKEMGKKIRAIRIARKIPLRKLRKLCDLNFTSISRMESGQYSSRILTLKAIADVLKVDVKDFL